MNYCPNCGTSTGGNICNACRRRFAVQEFPFITVEEIATTQGNIIPLVKTIREELNCSLLKAKKIVDLIRMTDDQVRDTFNLPFPT